MDSIQFQFLPQAEIKAYQEKKLAESLEYIAAKSPYYKKLFAEEKIDIKNIWKIEDLRVIPVTTKKDLNYTTWISFVSRQHRFSTM